MKKNTLFFAFIISISAFANEKTTDKNNESVNIGNPNCIVEYSSKLDQLLPLEVIKKHYDVPVQAKKNYISGLMGKKYDIDTYSYRWNSDRTEKTKLMDKEIDRKVQNEIGLTWVGNDRFMMPKKATPKENFLFFYRNVSETEKSQNLDKAGEKMKQQGYDAKSTDEAVATGKDFSTGNKEYEVVQGIGEAAVWYLKMKCLIVLVGKTSFQVKVNISANDTENIALAKKLALEVLNKCK
jgi:hypothetical protein